MISRGDVVWVDFGIPRGSEPAKARPAVVVQDDRLLASRLQTVLVVPLSSNRSLAGFPGNVGLPAEATGLERDSVALVTQVSSVSREFIEPHAVGSLPSHLVAGVDAGIRLALGL